MENLVQWFKDNDFQSVAQGMAKLTDELGIKVKDYPEEDLYVFNYNQIESPKTHPVVMESRGIILQNDFTPVCRPFDRFFNMGEALDITSEIDVSRSLAYEKVDGSLVKLYWYGNKWNVGTRGTAFAESENYTGKIFQDMIWEAFSSEGNTDLLDKECTYILEFISPENRVVTPYKQAELVLLGVRVNSTGEERDIANEIDKFKGFNVRLPKMLEFGSDEHLKEVTNSLDGLQEGFVVFDPVIGQRMKVKSEAYVAVHRLRGDCVPTPKRICGLVVTNEQDEYLAYFPEDKEMFQPYVDAFHELMYKIKESWAEHKDLETQKDFALAVKDLMYSWALFQARAKGLDPVTVFDNADAKQRVRNLMQFMEL